MASPVVMNVKDATVKFVLASAVTTPPPDFATAPDFTCQVTSASIKSNPKLQTVPATFCAAESQSPSASGWQLDLTWLQDWSAATGSMSQFMFDNDAELAYFQIVPNDPTGPGAEGQCYLVAGDYLGAAGAVLTATATCPCPAKPTISATITMATSSASAREEPEPQYADA